MTDRTVQPQAFRFDAADVPNHDWPLLLYRGALPGVDADAARRRLAEHGWGGAWTDGVYPYTHYHDDAHEVLAVVAGRARIRFGGEAGTTVDVEAGDVAVLPAGTGHRRVEADDAFLVVGAYPEGQEAFTTRRPDREDEPVARAAVRAVPRPAQDPLYGPDGPLLDCWPALD